MICCLVLLASVVPAIAADDIVDAIDQARKAYQSGDLTGAKQSLDLASQLIGQKNAEAFAALLPPPLAGWKADDAQTSAVGQVGFGASTANRTYNNDKGDRVEITITGDSAMIMQFATAAGQSGDRRRDGQDIKVGNQRALQTREGDINIVAANKFLVT